MAAVWILKIRHSLSKLRQHPDRAVTSSDEVTVGKCLVKLIEESLFELARTVVTEVSDRLRPEDVRRFQVEHSEGIVVRAVRFHLRRILAARLCEAIEEAVAWVRLGNGLDQFAY